MDDPVIKVVEGALEGKYEGAGDMQRDIGYFSGAALRILQLRVKYQREYFEGREKLRVPKGKEYTDFDRNTMLEASVAALREKYEYVKGLEELVRERVELYKLMMKNG